MEASGADDVDNLKSKLLSAWHNMKYRWVVRTKTYFTRNSPVLLLGKCYHFKNEESIESSPDGSDMESETNEDGFGTAEDFRKDFSSKIWLTYREEFPQLAGSTWTTDCGWGCTLRTGQMLLAQGLLVHFLGRDWLWPNALNIYQPEADFLSVNSSRKLSPLDASYINDRNYGTASCKRLPAKDHDEKNQTDFYHRKIISWFADHPLADFGIHQLIKLGKDSSKVAGDWYGPAVVSHLLRKAIEESVHPELQGISVYIAQDCTIYCSDVYDQQNNSDCEKSVLILVPVRLGGERANTEYFEFVKVPSPAVLRVLSESAAGRQCPQHNVIFPIADARKYDVSLGLWRPVQIPIGRLEEGACGNAADNGILSLEYCVGIIGGKPKQSYYFVGFQDDGLIYMDPHYCQSFVDVSIKDFPLESFHCPSPKKMPFKKMDPSCTIGFYCRNARDFEKAVDELTKVLKSSSKQNYPLFTFVNGHAQDFDFVCAPVCEQHDLFTEDEKKRLKRFSTEEFVLL